MHALLHILTRRSPTLHGVSKIEPVHMSMSMSVTMVSSTMRMRGKSPSHRRRPQRARRTKRLLLRMHLTFLLLLLILVLLRDHLHLRPRLQAQPINRRWTRTRIEHPHKAQRRPRRRMNRARAPRAPKVHPEILPFVIIPKLPSAPRCISCNQPQPPRRQVMLVILQPDRKTIRNIIFEQGEKGNKVSHLIPSTSGSLRRVSSPKPIPLRTTLLFQNSNVSHRLGFRERRRQTRQTCIVSTQHFARRLPIIQRKPHRDSLLKAQVPHEDCPSQQRRARARQHKRFKVNIRICGRRGVRNGRGEPRCRVELVDDRLSRGRVQR